MLARGLFLPLAVLATLALVSGCAPAPVATTAPSPPPDLGDQAWEVSGGGDFVVGLAILCPSEESILIEDAEALADPDADLVWTMTFLEGALTYSTSWYSTSIEPPPGSIRGSGTYQVEVDSAGLPTRLSADGVVEILGDDSTVTEQRDHIELSFTAIERPEYCVG